VMRPAVDPPMRHGRTGATARVRDIEVSVIDDTARRHDERTSGGGRRPRSTTVISVALSTVRIVTAKPEILVPLIGMPARIFAVAISVMIGEPLVVLPGDVMVDGGEQRGIVCAQMACAVRP
jgi:hypothetical protein